MRRYVDGGRKEVDQTYLRALYAALSRWFVKDDKELNYGVNTAVFTVANCDKETGIKPVSVELTPLPPVKVLSKIKVMELKNLMTKQKLPTKGKKAELVAILTRFLTLKTGELQD
mmetsp:Transcript_39689/g.40299  ORF Transcript_39689/g.40299 Transcript_39689/m.40299 type:complete len:115 (-) Transcript_39689:293-637(-)